MPEKKVRVTIGIPFFNNARTLAAAIRSVFAQTFQDWELILVDDGSTDGSWEIAAAVRDPRVSIYRDGRNRGLAYRLNQIARLAHGEYLARMDADDLMHPKRLAEQVAFLDAHPEVDVVDTAMYSMDEQGRVLSVRGLEKFRPTKAAALKSKLLHHATILGRTSWFRRNLYDVTLARSQDHELWCRTFRTSVFGHISQPLYFCREGKIRLANYLGSQKANCCIIRKYGPDLMGRLATQQQLIASLIKSAAYGILTPLGLSRLLVAMRNRRLTPEEKAAGEQALRQIAATSVPGLKESARRTQQIVHVMTVPESLNFLSGLPDFLRRRGFSVHVVASGGKLLTDFAAREAVTAHAVRMERRITPFRDMVALWRLWRLFRRLRPTIVHSHTPKGGLLGTLAACLARVPVRIYTMHGLPLLTARGWKRWLLYWTERITCRYATGVSAVSRSLCNVVVEQRLCPAEKIKVLLQGSIAGVDALGRFNPANRNAERESIRRQYGIPQDALVLGFVGRIVRDKGCVELTYAWRQLRETFPTAYLLMVGPFEPHDPLPADVLALLSTDERVCFTGRVADTAAYYAAMDVLVLPTYREGFPNVVLEAAAMELPVVATQTIGCVDAVVDGKTGMLVPVGDAGALSDALRIYLADESLRRGHGAAGRERVLAEFRPEPIRQTIYDLYVEQLRERGLPLPSVFADEAKETDLLHLPRQIAA